MAAALELLRHGATGFDGFRGQIDDPLSAEGWAQLRAAVHGRRYAGILSSPLRRCSEFAQELASALDCPLSLHDGLMEYDFGDWSGLTPAELHVDAPEALGRFWADPERHPPPGAESLAALEVRVRQALAGLPTGQGTQLVVTHGGVIRLLLCRARGLSLKAMPVLEVPHASLHPFDWPLAGTARA
ncbi:MAG: histidine phosphatase family protein [Aquimonas sp.]|nr:histidine phosphatase family protein [Aquimonas sp.]